MRLIDANTLKEQWETQDAKCGEYTAYHFLASINDAPTIKAEPIRHGRWLDTYNDGDWHCSECGAIVEKDEQSRHYWQRCYHCGARMVEDVFADHELGYEYKGCQNC